MSVTYKNASLYHDQILLRDPPTHGFRCLVLNSHHANISYLDSFLARECWLEYLLIKPGKVFAEPLGKKVFL